MRAAIIEPMFADLKRWLPPLIQAVVAKQRTEEVVRASGPFPIAAQRALGLEVMAILGFDFDGGRLDVSTHPFCGGVAEDVRITTRYREDDFVQALMGIVHETGHARYEQRLPRDWVHLPLGIARSMGIHESQSLSFEMQLGRSRPFLELIAPLVRKHLGDQPAFSVDNLARIYTRVRPGLVRTESDELTYPMHIILRFEIERAIIENEIEPEDVPAIWAEKMRAYLDQDTRDNYTNGCLQDIHWSDGTFGYFPSYTLGAMYAAQYFAAIRKAVPDLDARIAAGDVAPIFAWLETHIWSQASRWETPELVERATGAPLSASHFERHLRSRYLE
jgi:carboxypeptidase Taq